MISETVLKEFIELIRHERWTMRYAASKIGFSHVYVANVINRREIASHDFLTKVFFLLLTYQSLTKQPSKIKVLR